MKKDNKTQQLQNRMLIETGMADDMLKNFNKGFVGLAQVEASRVRENEEGGSLCDVCYNFGKVIDCSKKSRPLIDCPKCKH